MNSLSMFEKGLFCSCEGLDGTGKSTSLNILRRMLEKHDIRAVYTAEPAFKQSKYSQMIKHLLVTQSLSKPLQASLFAVARKLHVQQVLTPAKKHRNLVISSRGILSSLAYQSDYWRGHVVRGPAGHRVSMMTVDLNHVYKLNADNIPNLESYLPDVNFYFEMNASGEKERLLGRPDKHDKFDEYMTNQKHIQSLQKSYHYGIKQLAKHGSPTVTINASKLNQFQRAQVMYNWIIKHLD